MSVIILEHKFLHYVFQCKHDFCWVCQEPWKKHSSATGGYFRCNRYEVVRKVSTGNWLSRQQDIKGWGGLYLRMTWHRNYWHDQLLSIQLTYKCFTKNWFSTVKFDIWSILSDSVCLRHHSAFSSSIWSKKNFSRSDL